MSPTPTPKASVVIPAVTVPEAAIQYSPDAAIVYVASAAKANGLALTGRDLAATARLLIGDPTLADAVSRAAKICRLKGIVMSHTKDDLCELVRLLHGK